MEHTPESHCGPDMSRGIRTRLWFMMGPDARKIRPQSFKGSRGTSRPSRRCRRRWKGSFGKGLSNWIPCSHLPSGPTFGLLALQESSLGIGAGTLERFAEIPPRGLALAKVEQQLALHRRQQVILPQGGIGGQELDFGEGSFSPVHSRDCNHPVQGNDRRRAEFHELIVE